MIIETFEKTLREDAQGFGKEEVSGADPNSSFHFGRRLCRSTGPARPAPRLARRVLNCIELKAGKMKSLEKGINYIALVLCAVIFGSVLLAGFFIQSDYNFGDFPTFQPGTAGRYAGIVLFAAALLLLYRYFENHRINLLLAIGIYAVLCILFILAVPLEPYSDMQSIFSIACNDFYDSDGYLTVYRNQIPITAYLYILTRISKNIIIPKLFNVIWNSVIVLFIYKIGSMIYKKADFLIIMSCIFLAPILYTNHIYNDTLATALTLIMIYLTIKAGISTPEFILLIILSALQYTLRASGIIFIIAVIMYFLLVKKEIRKTAVYAIASVLLIAMLSGLMNFCYPTDSSGGYPVWSFLQMGINEEEFGFQDGSHSTEWTSDDYREKIADLGAARLSKLLVKKEFWMWSEGTYQAGRYGFGDSAAVYTTENAVTESLRDTDGSMIRKVFDAVMKGQYYVYMLLAAVGLAGFWKKKAYQLFAYLFCGYFCFYLLWEMKSRYIYSLYPYLIIIAYGGLLRIIRLAKSRAGHKDIVEPSPGGQKKSVRRNNS